MGFASVPRSGRPSRKPRPRFNVSNSSCDRFSTIRVMLPVSTDSSIDEVSTSVRFAASALEKSDLVGRLAGDAVVDRPAQLPFEFRHQRGTFALQRVPRVEVELLFLAHVGPVGAVHEQLAHAVHHLRERNGQARDREIPAIAEDLWFPAAWRGVPPPRVWSSRSRHGSGLSCRLPSLLPLPIKAPGILAPGSLSMTSRSPFAARQTIHANY